ncbi:MAG: HDOD domain-containing protein [Bryobacteraceae bacterium]
MTDKVPVTSLSALPFGCQEQALQSLSKLPPFTPILTTLLANLANEDVSFARLASLIEKDTVLAGNVLRLVNSVLYGRLGTITSVSHAISIMGLPKLQKLALGFSVHRLWNSVRPPRGWSLSRFNLHSVAVGIACDLLAQRTHLAYPEGAFVCGLFHDLGELLIAISLPQQTDEIQRLTALNLGREKCQREVLGWTAAELSAAALEKWNLPKPVQMAVAYQHCPSSAPPETFQGLSFSLSDVLSAANEIANETGISIEPFFGEPAADAGHAALDVLGLGSDAENIVAEFRAEYSSLRELV